MKDDPLRNYRKPDGQWWRVEKTITMDRQPARGPTSSAPPVLLSLWNSFDILTWKSTGFQGQVDGSGVLPFTKTETVCFYFPWKGKTRGLFRTFTVSNGGLGMCEPNDFI